MVERFRLIDSGWDYSFFEDKDGQYVAFKDYQALESKLDTAVRALRELAEKRDADSAGCETDEDGAYYFAQAEAGRLAAKALADMGETL